MNTAALKTKLDTKAQAIAESVEEETAAALAPVDSNYWLCPVMPLTSSGPT